MERKRSVDRRQNEKYSRKRSASRSKSPNLLAKKSSFDNEKRSHNHRSNQDERKLERSLSYSPARRNPERYKEILDSKTKSNERSKKPQQSGPVVKLQSNSSEDESSDAEGNAKVEEFLSIDKSQDKELNRLKALKSELAAKAKVSLEKKITSEAALAQDAKSNHKQHTSVSEVVVFKSSYDDKKTNKSLTDQHDKPSAKLVVDDRKDLTKNVESAKEKKTPPRELSRVSRSRSKSLKR
jgi:serine/arginine repetitive matrix protein 2